MNYQETLSYLFNSTPVFQHVGGSAYKAGLENSIALDTYFHHPHRKFHTIHVGGTNGKGSTSHLLASILQQSGYRIGLYTSPHLSDFRERIRINGQMISKDYVVDFVAHHRAFFEKIQPSFFELTMMMAFCYFSECEVDIAIIEVGLGGKLDSTNIISPVLSIITNISIDHPQFLGISLEEIAGEKAGIIKPGIPVIIGEAKGKVKQIFQEKAEKEHSPIIFAEDESIIKEAVLLPEGKWLFQTDDYPDLKGELGGLAQQKNAATVLCAVKELKNTFNISKEAVYQGFKNVVELTGLQGRWQLVGSSPKIIIDTGHNEAGIAQIVNQLKLQKFNRLHIVFGLAKDKDIHPILKLLPSDAIYYFTRAQIPRSLPEEELHHLALKNGLTGEHYPSVKDAINKAKEIASSDDMIFIGGSNFIVAEALELFNS